LSDFVVINIVNKKLPPTGPDSPSNEGSVVKKPIDAGKIEKVSRPIEKLRTAFRKAALKLFTRSGRVGKFFDLESNDSIKLIESRNGAHVADNLNKLTGLDRNESLNMIESGQGGDVAENLDELAGLDDREVALKWIEEGDADYVVRDLKIFTGLDREVALKLIEIGEGSSVAENLEKFTGLDKEVVFKLIEARKGRRVAENLEKFIGLDHREVALKLIENEQGWSVIYNLEKFTGLDLDREVAIRLIENGNGTYVVSNLNKFTGLDLDREVALKLIESKEGSFVADNLEKFSFSVPADYFQVASAILMIAGDIKRARMILQEAPSSPDEAYLALDDRLKFFLDESVPSRLREDVETYGLDISPQARRSRLTLNVSSPAFGWMEVNRSEVLKLGENERPNWIGIAAALKEYMDHKGEDQMVINSFSLAVESFGPEASIRYVNRPSINYHDAFYFMGDLVNLCERNNLNTHVNGPKLLHEVAMDMTPYDEGSAYNKFAAVVQSLCDVSVEDTFERVGQYKNVNALQGLVQDFGVIGAGPFDSWKAFKKFHDIHHLLGRSEILDELSQGQMSDSLRTYVEKLAFHPNINTEAVISFWKTPDVFLEINDEHSSQEINRVKKPSNYLSLPFLGLKAEDLRDALIEGAMDHLQTLPAQERIYELYEPGQDPGRPEDLHAFLRNALGHRASNKPGEARRPKKLFSEIQKFCRENNVSMEILKETRSDILAHLSPVLYQALLDLIFDENFGLPKLPHHKKYRIRIGLKSNPEMVVAGNDTASCMPFGSGKNNVYMFNPNCVQLVVEKQLGDDTWRTAAQSVVTIDAPTSRPTQELVSSYMKQIPLKDLLDEKDLVRQPVITCDNIEVAKNEEGNASAFIAEAYRRFFGEYLQNHADTLGVDPSRVVIGTGYTPAQLGFPKEENHYIPLAPMGYSDNIHEHCMILQTNLPTVEAWKPTPGVTEMTTRDVLPVAMLEGKAYHDNQSLLENLHGMQNNIVGMEIANQHFHRPSLSFVYRDDKGFPKGYVLAYAGVIAGKGEIFLSDLAADPESKMAGGRLIKKFFDSYCDHYEADGRSYLPIFTNARERTSYRILARQLQTLARSRGLVAEMQELGSHSRGDDTFYDVRIFVAKNSEDLEKQKTEYTNSSKVSSESEENHEGEY
jgi:hypothetical protein